MHLIFSSSWLNIIFELNSIFKEAAYISLNYAFASLSYVVGGKVSDAFQSKVQRFNPEQEMFEDIPDLAVRKQKKENQVQAFLPFLFKKNSDVGQCGV